MAVQSLGERVAGRLDYGNKANFVKLKMELD